jgi:hypothetical protein
MDPERPIEKLLREAARARRAQAGSQELHPANRRMLQGEIARKFGSGSRENRSFFELFMPRLGWAAAMLVGLGLAASLMLPRQNTQPKEMFFAKNDRVSAPHRMNEALPAAPIPKAMPPAEAPALARADQYAYASGTARLEVAQVERDKDSLNTESRRADGQREQLAKNEPTAARQAGSSLGGASATEKRKEELASRSLRTAVPSQTLAPQDDFRQRRYGLASSAQPVTTAPAGAAGFAAAEAKPTDEMAKAKLADSASASSGVLPASSSAFQLNATNSADVAKRSPASIARVSQQFVQTDSLKKIELADKSAVGKPILASFELQQLGRQVRIVDGDGSIYSGNFQTPQTYSYLDSETRQKGEVTSSLKTAAPPPSNNPLALPSESAVQRKGALYDSKLQADLSYPFQVTGTNRTLNQIVTFTGQVLTPTNVLSVLGPAGTLNGNRAAPPDLNPLPLGNSRISGKALIGANREVEVNAIPAH